MLALAGLAAVAGCASVYIPNYLQNEHPYVRRYYAGFDQAKAVVTSTLKTFGWTVEEQLDPVVYEQRPDDKSMKEVMLVTKTRPLPFFLGTRYGKMNVFVRNRNNITGIEIRYMTITSFLLKNFTSYRNDAAVQRIFDKVGTRLGAGAAP
jgi:hypothetical protein